MPFSRRRWICLLAATVIEVLLGIAYAWSVFSDISCPLENPCEGS